MRISELNIMPVRHDWNALGPPIPLWFRAALKKLDPTLVLQFIPPDHLDPKGMNHLEFPFGGWQICRRLKRVGWLHKLCVWSLMDRFGCFSPPGPDTIRILRIARNLWKHKQFTKMEEEMEKSIQDIKKTKADASFEDLMGRMDRFLSLQGNRMSSNRVFIRGGKPQIRKMSHVPI